MATITELRWASMTAAVNEIKSPAQFINRLVFNRADPQSTEDIEISVLSGNRVVAPFVRKNGEALMVEGLAETFQTVQAPNIRIKRPLTPSELFFTRRPGSVIFPTTGQQVSAIQAHIARDLQFMADMITNAEEYLAAQAIRGAIAYSVADQENFTITYPRDGGNTITLTTFWDDSDPSNVQLELNFLTAKKVINDATGLNPTDAIFGETAATTFLEVIRKERLAFMDASNINAGYVSFVERFRDDGAMFLGVFSGIRCWYYPRTVTVSGSSYALARDKYVEFLAVSPMAENVRYYGAIPDMKTLQGRRFVGRRFSKSWEVEDPSSRMSLIHSRPLPVPRRPNSTLSMKVISG